MYSVEVDGFEWEISEFGGENRGLVLAEVKADSEAALVKPEWLGDEVSSDSRFQNANLIDNPFSNWTPSRKKKSQSFISNEARAFARHVYGSLQARSTARFGIWPTRLLHPTTSQSTRRENPSKRFARLCGSYSRPLGTLSRCERTTPGCRQNSLQAARRAGAFWIAPYVSAGLPT